MMHPLERSRELNILQCHSRESGNLPLEMRCLIKEVPAFAGMTLLSASICLGRRVPRFRGDDIAFV